MHRLCLRSTLAQCTEQRSIHPAHALQRCSFSSSAPVSANTPARKKRLPKTSRPSSTPPRNEPRLESEAIDEDLPPTRDIPFRKLVPDRTSKSVNSDPRTYYINTASSDPGLTEFDRMIPTKPTPIPFIDPEPLLVKLIKGEKQSFVGDAPAVREGDIHLEEELALTANLPPGSFIELRRNERSVEAIVLSNSLIDSKLHTLCLVSSGEILAVLPTNVFFSIPNIVSLDLITRCGTALVHQTPQEINARVQTLKALRTLSIQAQQASQGSRIWDRTRIMNIYDEVKNPDPTRWGEVTLEHVTSLFYVQPTYVNFYATHKYLMERPLKYIAETGYIRNQTFRVRPERDVKEVQTVEDWITFYRKFPKEDGPYIQFIRKAQKVAASNRKTLDTPEGPTSQKPANWTWSDTDQVILSYLLRSLQQHMSSQLDPYRVGRSAIVKDILQVEEVTDDVIHKLLIRLGVIAPWQDLYVLSPMLNPSGDFSTKNPVEKEADRVFRASSHPQAIAGQVLGPYDMVPKDPLDSVRHDFGNMTVFVIDDPTASELDDGISLERIPSEPENNWVHVHIADPARHLHPGHALSHIARKQFASAYLVSGNFAMLPTSFVHNPAYGLSLTDSSESNVPNYALTFSFKLDGKANILDYKLRAGVLRNVVKTTYYDVDTILNGEPPMKNYPFGDAPPDPPRSMSFSEDDVADLRLLKKLAEDQVKKRVFDQRLISLASNQAHMEIKTLPTDDIRSPDLRGSVYSGFPELRYIVSSLRQEDRGSRRLVSEMMKLACRVASRVALDHNIPLIRRCAQPFIWGHHDFEDVWKLADEGYITHQDFIRLGAYATTGHYSQAPGAHAVLGLPTGEGYVRVTSPLRRYMDLVMHWQLHHLLLGPNAPARLPFDSADMDKLIVEAGIKDVQHRRQEKANNYFYALIFIKRYLEAAKRNRLTDHPLKNIAAYSIRSPGKDVMNMLEVPVMLPELGIQAQALNLPSHCADIPPGSDLRVELKSIELGLRRTKLYVSLASS